MQAAGPDCGRELQANPVPRSSDCVVADTAGLPRWDAFVHGLPAGHASSTVPAGSASCRVFHHTYLPAVCRARRPHRGCAAAGPGQEHAVRQCAGEPAVCGVRRCGGDTTKRLPARWKPRRSAWPSSWATAPGTAPCRVAAATDWPTQDLYVTFRKEILPDEEANMLAIPRKQRAMVRKGIKNGLTARDRRPRGPLLRAVCRQRAPPRHAGHAQALLPGAARRVRRPTAKC
jgi:hypothetical protein